MEIVNTQKKKKKKNNRKKPTKNNKNASVFVWTLEGVFNVEIDNIHTYINTNKLKTITGETGDDV